MAKLSAERFIEKARRVHGDKYDYSLIEYKTCKDKVEIVCNTCGNHFNQTPDNHINLKRGCPVCGAERSAKSRKGKKFPHERGNRCTTEEWIKKVLKRYP
ncbi:hypothetical protein N5V81_21785 [Escherichia coli]|nr:hypothetical protein [Escherichia coli]